MSVKSLELRQQRAKLVAEMHDLTEKTTFVGEAQERWNKLDGEQKSLESQINAIEATEKLNTEMRESKNGHKETAQPGADTRSNAVGATSLAGDSDVSFTSVANGDVVTFNSGSGKWVNSPSSSATLAGDTDVDITSPANGDVLTYQSSGSKWVNAPPAGGGGGGGSSPTGTLMAYGQPNPFSGGPPAYNYGNVFNYAGLSQGNAPSIARSSVTGGLPAATRLSTTLNTPTSFAWWGSYSQETVCASLLAQIQFTIALNSITSTRVWMGVGFGASSTLETATPACSLIAFRFDTAVDTNWQAVVGNGTTTVVDTGVAADTNFHQFKITRDGSGGFNFSIDGTIAANIPSGSAGMPASTSQMGDLIQIDADGVTGAAVTLDLVSMSCWLIY